MDVKPRMSSVPPVANKALPSTIPPNAKSRCVAMVSAFAQLLKPQRVGQIF